MKTLVALTPTPAVSGLLACFSVLLLLVSCGGLETVQPTDLPVSAPPVTVAPGGHHGSEGLVLGPETGGETVSAGVLCDTGAPVRAYQVAAVNVEITLNRFLDYDPEGRMYVLGENLARVRREESRNRSARADQSESAVTTGLQGDAIQPLTIRVNQGECLQVTLRNAMDNGESVSLHLHGSSLHLAASGAPAIATNPEAIVATGETVTYEWKVDEDEPEGTHYFHSHGNTRQQTSHGLFGALIVEPRGSVYLDPLSGGELDSGWAAVIRDPNGADFREFAIYYHEIGNEAFTILSKSGVGNIGSMGRAVPFVDEFSGAYKPGGRAMNYRSEPFMNRMEQQHDITGSFDLSQAYSSYTFGDPATPVARSYLGDPVKQRLVHGGSEVFHVHHVHGGAIRWRRQSDVEPTAFDSGFDKNPPLLPVASARTDSQTVGPSESFDVANECGSGGCQHSVGDYLVHCHVAHHYVAGMWMIWRVYNTLQDVGTSQDSLPPLQELPDRLNRVSPAVTSRDLVGTIVDWKGKTFDISRNNLAAWVERQLPPYGTPKGDDASVLNWKKEEDLYLNEPDSELVWPAFRSDDPGGRPPLYFNPVTGKLAYPFLRPHLGRRPPFAPNHGPAPFLEPFRQGTDPPQPGENGPWSLCQSGTIAREFVIHAINLPIVLNPRTNLVDPVGQLFVLKEDEAEVRATNDLKVPLAIRGNAAEDCIDVVFKSELEDTRENHFFSKVSIHIHFVQFDVQASDGVNAGFNYETSVRPFSAEGEKTAVDSPAGGRTVQLTDTQRFQEGILVGVGMDQNETFEVRRIQSIEDDTLVFEEPLTHAHARGEIVSTEFVRYRWYPDVQFGTAYFHDHVNALTSWRHGLFGALVSEPPGSTFHDHHTGEEVRSGPVVDIHTDSVVSSDITGSFREMVLFIQDDNPRANVGQSSGSSFNLRVEPLATRDGDSSLLFSSQAHGDPATPLLEAFLGDPVVIRSVVSATNDVHTLHVDGHWFRVEPHSLTSPPVNTVHVGISERYDLAIPRAGGPQGMAGDYLYYNGRSFKLREGSWGIMRVYDGEADVPLEKLPGHEAIPLTARSVCPAEAQRKEFSVFAMEVPLPMLGSAMGKVYVLDRDKDRVSARSRAAEPMVLHVNVGDCIVVRLTNETAQGSVSFHVDMLAFDPKESQGVAAGVNPPQAVEPGETRTYTYFAHPEVGETAALVRDWGNVLQNPGLGLYGAIIVGPRDAVYTDPATGEDMSSGSSWKVDVHHPIGESYRDFTLFIQDEDEVIGTHIMPYTEQVKGVVGLNYWAEPLSGRLASDGDPATLFNSNVHGDPVTPLMEAMLGDPAKVHVIVPFSEQAHVFSIEGHRWPAEPRRDDSDLLSAVQIGGSEAVTLVIDGGAGIPGDYLYGDHREPYREAGLWGLFRVYPPDVGGLPLLPLD